MPCYQAFFFFRTVLLRFRDISSASFHPKELMLVYLSFVQVPPRRCLPGCLPSVADLSPEEVLNCVERPPMQYINFVPNDGTAPFFERGFSPAGLVLFVRMVRPSGAQALRKEKTFQNVNGNFSCRGRSMSPSSADLTQLLQVQQNHRRGIYRVWPR